MCISLQYLIDHSRGVSLPLPSYFRIDDNFLSKFPIGTTILSTSSFSTPGWTVRARLHLKLPDGSEERYLPPNNMAVC
ncbi:uncharacterized protein F4807DRAFT_445072 [Annulohypoxylon truncatum]|uniref:uncharacterized protein n=1 Tax=Annulohypoxylon truncatum TaxID=327061 RepID=UPI0020076378|nr:uncharacterized protein F4807DRAFT_445072 [Annulohypoxylon truncatum]KAI1204935.1 hypothetical protein F4807DRAFT_445072 [Annulohypoxylon truncatum]